jgi:hypothetical protein
MENVDRCVIAVRFENLKEWKHDATESWGIYLYELERQPEIIGYCVIPADYIFR